MTPPRELRQHLVHLVLSSVQGILRLGITHNGKVDIVSQRGADAMRDIEVRHVGLSLGRFLGADGASLSEGILALLHTGDPLCESGRERSVLGLLRDRDVLPGKQRLDAVIERLWANTGTGICLGGILLDVAKKGRIRRAESQGSFTVDLGPMEAPGNRVLRNSPLAYMSAIVVSQSNALDSEAKVNLVKSSFMTLTPRARHSASMYHDVLP